MPSWTRKNPRTPKPTSSPENSDKDAKLVGIPDAKISFIDADPMPHSRSPKTDTAEPERQGRLPGPLKIDPKRQDPNLKNAKIADADTPSSSTRMPRPTRRR